MADKERLKAFQKLSQVPDDKIGMVYNYILKQIDEDLSSSESSESSSEDSNDLIKREIEELMKMDFIPKRNKIDKANSKYRITLKFVNGILDNIGREHIDDLLDFKDVKREDIIGENNKKYLEDIASTIFTHYDKKLCRYYKRAEVKHYILTLLRYMCKDIGLKLVSRRKNLTIKGKQIVDTCYSIYAV